MSDTDLDRWAENELAWESYVDGLFDMLEPTGVDDPDAVAQALAHAGLELVASEDLARLRAAESKRDFWQMAYEEESERCAEFESRALPDGQDPLDSGERAWVDFIRKEETANGKPWPRPVQARILLAIIDRLAPDPQGGPNE